MSASKLKLYWRLQLAAHFMRKYADRELVDKATISTAQTGVLAVIANRQDVTQKDVATALGLNESAVTAMVRRLIALGYVQRRTSKEDSRARLLTLTTKGKEVQTKVRPPFRQINKRIESVLTPIELDNLADYIEKLTKAFK